MQPDGMTPPTPQRPPLSRVRPRPTPLRSASARRLCLRSRRRRWFPPKRKPLPSEAPNPLLLFLVLLSQLLVLLSPIGLTIILSRSRAQIKRRADTRSPAPRVERERRVLVQ